LILPGALQSRSLSARSAPKPSRIPCQPLVATPFACCVLRQWIERGQATPPPRCPVCRNEITQDPASLHVNIVLADLVRLRAARASAGRSTATLGTLAQPSTAIPASSGAPKWGSPNLPRGQCWIRVTGRQQWRLKSSLDQELGLRSLTVPSLTAPQKASLASVDRPGH